MRVDFTETPQYLPVLWSVKLSVSRAAKTTTVINLSIFSIIGRGWKVRQQGLNFKRKNQLVTEDLIIITFLTLFTYFIVNASSSSFPYYTIIYPIVHVYLLPPVDTWFKRYTVYNCILLLKVHQDVEKVSKNPEVSKLVPLIIDN